MNNSFRSQLRTDIIGCWIIATISLCAGLIINQFRDSPISLIYKEKSGRLDDVVTKIAVAHCQEARPRQAQSFPLPARLSLEEFKDLVRQDQGLVLDARPEIFHRLGHVPGAIALPRNDFENYYRKHQAELEKDKNQILVIYCSSGFCDDSKLVEASFRKLGYTQISIFEGGWDEWTRSGSPEETNQ